LATTAPGRSIADQRRRKLPKLSIFLDEAEAGVLTYKTFPADGLERLKGEIKRGTEAVGSPSAALPGSPTAKGRLCARSTGPCSSGTMNVPFGTCDT